MTVAANVFAAVFHSLPREVWVVTSASEGSRGGLTATWVVAATIDPSRPLTLVGLAKNHFTADLVDRSRSLALHLLRADQIDLAWNFARDSGRSRDKFDGLDTIAGKTGTPLLVDCLSRLECRVVARLAAGERTYYWAEAVDGEQFGGEQFGGDAALTDHVFMRGISDQQRQHLASRRDADIELQGPWHDQWLEALPHDLRPGAS